MIDFLKNLLQLSLEAAPWLVLGLLIGGLIKALIPASLLQRHLRGKGFGAVFKAALFGAPLPLCSCGVIPAALGLRRAGASKPATISFLVSTPETGVDSVSISYALLGPFMAVVRPVAAIVSAVTAGLLVGKAEDESDAMSVKNGRSDGNQTGSSCCGADVKPEKTEEMSCCSAETVEEPSCCSAQSIETLQPEKQSACCGSSDATSAKNESDSCCSAPETFNDKPETFLQKAWDGIVYSFVDLFNQVLFWLFVGLVFAALVKTFVPVTFLAEWGSGLPAMLVMLVIGIPMYVCATASTPIAAGLLLAGVSPGTAMVFLMAGPATNISTLGVIGKELGKRSLYAYLAGVGAITLLTGFVVDFLVRRWQLDIQVQIAHGADMVPPVIAWAALLLLLGVALKLRLGKFFLRPVAG